MLKPITPTPGTGKAKLAGGPIRDAGRCVFDTSWTSSPPAALSDGQLATQRTSGEPTHSDPAQPSEVPIAASSAG